VESERNGRDLAVTDETLDDRAARVRRRFKTGRLDAMGRGFWENWHPEDGSFLVGMFSTVTLLLLEPSLWMDNWPGEAIRLRISGPVALSLLLVLPFNGWFLSRFLSSKTPGGIRVPRWLRGLRFLALSLPLFGLPVISLWKAFLERSATRGPTTASRVVSLDLANPHRRLPYGLRFRTLYRSGFFFGWIVISFLPVLAWALWLAGARELGNWHRPMILGACVLLHLTACLFMAQHIRIEIRKSSVFAWRRALLLIAPLFWLMALPGMAAGFALFVFANPSRTSLSWKTHASRTGVDRDPLWQGIQGRLQQQWETRPWFTQWRRPAGLTRSEGPGRKDEAIISLYRLKTLLLALESMSLTVVLFRIPSLRVALSLGLRPVLWTAAVLAGTGALIQIAGLLARLFRVPRLGEKLNRHPYGRYLFLTQTAFLAGTYGGAALSQVSIEQFGFLLCLSAALCGLMTVIFLLLPTGASPKGPDMVLWGLLYLAISAVGGVIALEGEDWRTSLLSFFRISTALSPLWSFGLLLALGGWLLRPFSWRDVADWKLPSGFRATLAFVILVAVLPLGGLAVPFWIYARHRLWPRYEPFSRGRQELSLRHDTYLSQAINRS
jgi:hypothetical protein